MRVVLRWKRLNAKVISARVRPGPEPLDASEILPGQAATASSKYEEAPARDSSSRISSPRSWRSGDVVTPSSQTSSILPLFRHSDQDGDLSFVEKKTSRWLVETHIMNLQDDHTTYDPHLTSTVVESEASEPMARFFLVFADARLEELYRLRSTVQLQNANLLVYTVLLAYSIYALSGSAVSGHSMLALRWGLPLDVVYHLCLTTQLVCTVALLFISAAFRNSAKVRCHLRLGLRWSLVWGEGFVAAFFSLIIWFRCLVWNRACAAELPGSRPQDAFDASDGGDDELLLHSTLLLMYLGMYTHIRFKMLLFPGVSAVLAYPVSNFATKASHLSLVRQALNSVALLLVVAFIFVGQRRIEVTRRQNLVEAIHHQAKHCRHQTDHEAARQASEAVKENKQIQQKLWTSVSKAKANRFDGETLRSTPKPTALSCDPADHPVANRTGSDEGSRSGSAVHMNAKEAARLAATSCRPPVSAHHASNEAEAEAGAPLLESTPDEGFVSFELPNPNLDVALPESVATDWAAADRAVLRMRDPAYSLQEYHEDMVTAFPELSLYTFRPDVDCEDLDEVSNELMSSGRSRLEELSRTFGALYAVYWLMRLDMDGKQGFCFGYDDDFVIQPVPESPLLEDLLHKEHAAMNALEKQMKFYHCFPWEECHNLITSAGLFQAELNCQNPSRLKAMLVLTAIHDVMKNEAICPTVQKHHAPFCNYSEGQVIRDHDIALDYVLKFYGHAFPSYSGLDEGSQKLLRFTQGKMGFNNGWLVQGEAPPGALFHSFRQLIHEGRTDSADVAFYFMHWVTDLAGAEPTPLHGAEKFVQKLSIPLLASFFKSFPYVWKLGAMTETQVLEEYLQARWVEDPSLGLLPKGEDSIALMRLALHIQGSKDCLRKAFEALCREDQETLVDEMSRSGLPGQSYGGMDPRPGSPALLIYYGPAFLRKNGDSLGLVLAMLAEVYRRGRILFPLVRESLRDEAASVPDAGGEQPSSVAPQSGAPLVHTVTVRIEQLKDLAAKDIIWQTLNPEDPVAFFLVRKGALEAVVEKKQLREINSLLGREDPLTYLHLTSRRSDAKNPKKDRSRSVL